MSASRSGRSFKYGAILLALVGSGLALSASTQTWYTLHLTAAAGHSAALAVTGSNSAPAIAALSVAGLAFAGALALAGRVLRYVLAVLGLVLAGSVIGSAIGAIADPSGSSISVVTKATGIAGDASVRAVIGSTDATAWPALALTGGILLALAAVAVIAFAHTWPTASRRYGAVKDAAEPVRSDADAHLSARDAAIDDWDELSRGDDPTDGPVDEPTEGPTEDDPPVR
ncbi:Trp biosynthesis-associated membrane protein [Humibacter sp. RRB41]|uniref:Trp biosynthesis-associated membrane protein n=1 Tax=Humibacter sp. RRB41 TaxID=2919946 RepID=UPI001FAB000D|nr:Trp biosynthesis-associated membrane protein [Humibacter sp. RRB41]